MKTPLINGRNYPPIGLIEVTTSISPDGLSYCTTYSMDIAIAVKPKKKPRKKPYTHTVSRKKDKSK